MLFFNIKKKFFSTICFYSTLPCFKNFIPRLCSFKISPCKFLKGSQLEQEFPFLLVCFLTNIRWITQETWSHIFFVIIRHVPSDVPHDLIAIWCLKKQYFMCCIHNLCNNFTLKEFFKTYKGGSTPDCTAVIAKLPIALNSH